MNEQGSRAACLGSGEGAAGIVMGSGGTVDTPAEGLRVTPTLGHSGDAGRSLGEKLLDTDAN